MTTCKNPDEAGRPLCYLKQWRLKLGLTQEELATRLQTSKGVISRYETGARGLPLETLAALADALGLWIGELFLDPGLDPVERIRTVVDMLSKRQSAPTKG